MGRLALLTPSCGGQRADREEKRVAHGNEINRQQGRRQEQLDFKDPNQRSLLGQTQAQKEPTKALKKATALLPGGVLTTE